MFTGDESGNWLYRALHKAGFANQPTSTHCGDGLRLSDCYVTATCRCAPPKNKPLLKEIANCKPFLLREIELLKNVKVIIGLGRIGFDAALNAFREAGKIEFKKKPTFAHCVAYELGSFTFIASYHPSQQNTFTGRLTQPMLDKVFSMARQHLSKG